MRSFRRGLPPTPLNAESAKRQAHEIRPSPKAASNIEQSADRDILWGNGSSPLGVTLEHSLTRGESSLVLVQVSSRAHDEVTTLQTKKIDDVDPHWAASSLFVD
jgi:hypothetical protein